MSRFMRLCILAMPSLPLVPGFVPEADAASLEFAAGTAFADDGRQSTGILGLRIPVHPRWSAEAWLAGSNRLGRDDLQFIDEPYRVDWRRTAGVGVRYEFALDGARWTPFVRAGWARSEGDLHTFRVTSVPPEINLYEAARIRIDDSGAYLGAGASYRVNDRWQLQLQALHLDAGDMPDANRTLALVGATWTW
ncbi:MAG: autotransporter outer membrane beta-barrel domain-containing protein [Xanthomonadales bacterium]|nr:hypothetical protein [Xanthomonadales bacterium]MCC6593923.1 autotransporter outer membrane beta-barrel domain-containing protein [Xanthomonadales bacterium]MCE7932061.1 autotransporter outer membrane beta-barrel domain-containing protein [Xanthomonadales bacterium PRO6]